MASFLIGAEVGEKELKELEKQVTLIDGGKLWVIDFVPFQYGTLSEACPPHRKILSLLDTYQKGKLTLLQRVQEKDKEEEEEKERPRARTKTKPQIHDEAVDSLLNDETIADAELLELYKGWTDERRDGGHYMTERSLKMAIKSMSSYPVDIQKEALKIGISGSHRSLHPESVKPAFSKQPELPDHLRVSSFDEAEESW